MLAFLNDKLVQELKELLSTRVEEREDLEYKQILDVSNPRMIMSFTKLMMSMANTKGGYIVIGVNDQLEPIGLPDTFHIDEKELYNRINKYCSPHIKFDYREVYLDIQGVRKKFAIILVKESKEIIVAAKSDYYSVGEKTKPAINEGQVWIRQGSLSVLASVKELRALLQAKSSRSISSSRIAWPWPRSHYTESGDLNQILKTRMGELLDDFGVILEKEANKAGIDIFVFPLYRPFNLIGALTADEVIYVVSPHVGVVPTLMWLDWRDASAPLKGHDLSQAVRRDLGWSSIVIFTFPKSLLYMTFTERAVFLQKVAEQSVGAVISEAERQARIVTPDPIFRGRDFLLEEDLCFVVMPFREPFFRIYDKCIKPTLEDLSLRVLKADDIFTPNPIIEDIWEYINKARLIIVDVTGRNPNVFYELGRAHTVGKPTLILTQNLNDIPFDLQYLRFLQYVDNEQGWEKLRNDLKRMVLSILEKQEISNEKKGKNAKDGQ